MFIYTIIQLKASQSLSPMLFTTHRPSRAHACMHARNYEHEFKPKYIRTDSHRDTHPFENVRYLLIKAIDAFV